jgi:hypothetical protein
MSPRSPEEILAILEDQALEDEIRAVAAMSEGQIDDALRAEGADVGAVRAAGRELGARATRAREVQVPEGEAWVTRPPPPPRRAFGTRWMVPLAATLTAAVVVGGTMYATGKIGHRDVAAVDIGSDGSAAQARTVAKQIRASALDACDRADWQPCIDGLTAARSLDPAGDADPRVQAAWKRSEAALGHERQRAPNPDSKTPGRGPAFPDTK